MAGLYDRIGAVEDNVQVHNLVAGMKGYGTGIWTRQQVLDSVNSLLVVPLTGAAATDFAAIADALDGQANALNKLIYGNRIEAAMIAAEAGVLNEAGWRAALGIS